jgi:hypothetical protein
VLGTELVHDSFFVSTNPAFCNMFKAFLKEWLALSIKTNESVETARKTVKLSCRKCSLKLITAISCTIQKSQGPMSGPSDA